MKLNKLKEKMQVKPIWKLWIVWALTSLIALLAYKTSSNLLTETILKLSVTMCLSITFYIVVTFIKERKAKKEKNEDHK